MLLIGKRHHTTSLRLPAFQSRATKTRDEKLGTLESQLIDMQMFSNQITPFLVHPGLKMYRDLACIRVAQPTGCARMSCFPTLPKVTLLVALGILDYHVTDVSTPPTSNFFTQVIDCALGYGKMPGLSL